MKKIHQDPQLNSVAAIPQLMQNFKKIYDNLEMVQKGLNSYLETKRVAFPRFYFLSSEELLEILSETKDPTRVQPHLKKCFEGIAKLQFDDKKKIHGMYSSEGEYIPFVREIDPMAAQGAVEQWLVQVEDVMIDSIREQIQQSHDDYLKMQRKEWVLNRCGQSVLTVSMMYWTQQAESSMEVRGLKGLQDFLKKCETMVRVMG